MSPTSNAQETADGTVSESIARTPGPKRLVVCMDGTWNHPAMRKERDNGDQVYKPTNVLKTSRAVNAIDDVTATLILTGQPEDGDTVVIGSKTYTFQAQLTDGDGHVAIGSETQKSVENLNFAINKRSSRNRYSADTVRHPTVEARKVAGDRFSLEIAVRSDVPVSSADGDPFAVSSTLSHGVWMDKHEIAAEYRKRGADPALGIPQIAYYDIGVGALRQFPGFSNRVHRTVDNLFGGAAGAGFEGNIEDAYSFLTLNFEPGDEIYIFGFSRGASTARGLATFIDWMGGILRPQDAYWIPRYYDAHLAGASFAATRQEIFDERVKRRTDAGMESEKAHKEAERVVGTMQSARVRFLGVWDTVLAVSKKRAAPHVGATPPASVDNARHALAVDERRADFLPRIWEGTAADNPNQTLEQRWFAGVHTDVGGGYVNDGLANQALEWMLGEARAVGLGLDWNFLSSYPGYPQDEIHDSNKLKWRVIQTLTFRRKAGIREARVSDVAHLTLHPSLLVRMASKKTDPNGREHPKLEPYRPENVLKMLAGVPDLEAFLATIPGLPEGFELPPDVLAAIQEAR